MTDASHFCPRLPEGGKPLQWLLDNGLAEEGPDGRVLVQLAGPRALL